MIHQYKLNGYNIVLDTYSGSVHSVDDIAYDIIAMYPDTPAEEIVNTVCQKYAERPGVTPEDVRLCIDDVRALEKEGKLYSHDTFADMAKNAKGRFGNVIKALCLHVAHTCNLACPYCFAGQGRYSGQDALMSFETGRRALDFLAEHSGGRRNLEVDFFGGEPLMNFDVVKKLVEYAKKEGPEKGKEYRFTLTTNGILLDEKIMEFLNENIGNVVLSLDGRKKVHDALRTDRAGRGSYDTIVPKFQKFVKLRGDGEYYIRGTFTHANPDFTKDVFHMADLGFEKLSMEPVVCAQDSPFALTAEDINTIKGQYEILAQAMLERQRRGAGFLFYHYMIDLEAGPCIYKRISGCGSGTEYMAVTPEGDLYPCHQFVGEKKFKMGDIWNGVTNEPLRREFMECGVYSRKECADCWAKFYCSGGCAANAYHAQGTINGIYEAGCELFKKRIECAIMMKVAQADGTAAACGA